MGKTGKAQVLLAAVSMLGISIGVSTPATAAVGDPEAPRSADALRLADSAPASGQIKIDQQKAQQLKIDQQKIESGQIKMHQTR